MPLAITQATLEPHRIALGAPPQAGSAGHSLSQPEFGGLEKALRELGRAHSRLVLDEAQQYPPGALEKIESCLLLGLNLELSPHLCPGLAGRPLFAGHLWSAAPPGPGIRASRCLHLPGWSPPNRILSGAWVASGGTGTLWLQSGSLGLLASASGGVPRLLNLLARSRLAGCRCPSRAQPHRARAGPKCSGLIPAAADRCRA